MSGGTYSLKSTPNDRFFEKFFTAIARNLLKGNRREEILFVLRFDFWPGTRTLAFCLISQRTTYKTTAINILDKAECLVCAQIIRKKCEYLLNRYYRTCHIKLYSIIGCEQSALATFLN